MATDIFSLDWLHILKSAFAGAGWAAAMTNSAAALLAAMNNFRMTMDLPIVLTGSSAPL
jgi:hypothetical protein